MENNNQKDKLLIEINNDVLETKKIMKQNINNQLDNNKQVRELNIQAENLDEEAKQFYNNAKAVKIESYNCCDRCIVSIFCSKCCKNCELSTMRFVFILTIIGLIGVLYFVAAGIRCKSANLFC